MDAKYVTGLDVAHYAYDAGFRGIALTTAIAVSFAENGTHNLTAVNTFGNSPAGSRDRGLWQINSYWHREVTDAQAFDGDGCAHAAYVISGGGTNWHPWSTFNTGAYRTYMQEAQRLATLVQNQHNGYILRRYLSMTVDGNGKFTCVGPDVMMCQKLVGATPDGIFGPLTKGAVQKWQGAHGIAADGIVGPFTAASFNWSFVLG